MIAVARKKPERSPKRATSYRLPVDLLDALDKLSDRNRRTDTAELEIALEKHLAENGLWPPTNKNGHKSN